MTRALLAATALLLLPGCSSDDTTPKAAPRTTAPAGSGTGSAAITTTAPPTHVPPCDALTQTDLDSVGVAAKIGTGADVSSSFSLGTGGTEAACQWTATSAGNTFSVTLMVATGVDSSAYETALADPVADDPSVIDGLGEQAAYREKPSDSEGFPATNQLVVYSAGTLFEITSLDVGVIDKVKLVGLAAAIVPRL